MLVYATALKKRKERQQEVLKWVCHKTDDEQYKLKLSSIFNNIATHSWLCTVIIHLLQSAGHSGEALNVHM